MTEQTSPDDATHKAEDQQAHTPSGADREPTAEEAATADRHRADPHVADHEKEMNERGAHQEGEGRLP